VLGKPGGAAPLGGSVRVTIRPGVDPGGIVGHAPVGTDHGPHADARWGAGGRSRTRRPQYQQDGGQPQREGKAPHSTILHGTGPPGREGTAGHSGPPGPGHPAVNPPAAQPYGGPERTSRGASGTRTV